VRFIESPKNPKIKEIKKLLSSKKERDEKGQFVLEGPKAIEAYLQAGGKVLELLYSKDAKDLPKVNAVVTQCAPGSWKLSVMWQEIRGLLLLLRKGIGLLSKC